MATMNDEFEVCDDCLMVIANGDTSGIEDDDRLSDVLTGVDRIGHAHPTFSRDEYRTIPCECCGTKLHGARTTVVTLR
jgi:hypothetical protein